MNSYGSIHTRLLAISVVDGLVQVVRLFGDWSCQIISWSSICVNISNFLEYILIHIMICIKEIGKISEKKSF